MVLFFCSSLWTSHGLEEKKGPVSLLLVCFQKWHVDVVV